MARLCLRRSVAKPAVNGIARAATGGGTNPPPILHHQGERDGHDHEDVEVFNEASAASTDGYRSCDSLSPTVGTLDQVFLVHSTPALSKGRVFLYVPVSTVEMRGEGL